jgi:hypothetical protein
METIFGISAPLFVLLVVSAYCWIKQRERARERQYILDIERRFVVVSSRYTNAEDDDPDAVQRLERAIAARERNQAVNP